MSVEHYVVEHGGDSVGHLISLDCRFVLYTTHPRLADLDGQRFNSIAQAHASVLRRLERRVEEVPLKQTAAA